MMKKNFVWLVIFSLVTDSLTWNKGDYSSIKTQEHLQTIWKQYETSLTT